MDRLAANGPFLLPKGREGGIYMSQINVQNLTFSYEGSFDNIFENVSFSIDTDWKLGFIGRNGKGKTTFLHLLMGKYPYRGSISASSGFEYFPYRIDNSDADRSASEFIGDIKQNCELSASSLCWKKMQICYTALSAHSVRAKRQKFFLLFFSPGKMSSC